MRRRRAGTLWEEVPRRPLKSQRPSCGVLIAKSCAPPAYPASKRRVRCAPPVLLAQSRGWFRAASRRLGDDARGSTGRARVRVRFTARAAPVRRLRHPSQPHIPRSCLSAPMSEVPSAQRPWRVLGLHSPFPAAPRRSNSRSNTTCPGARAPVTPVFAPLCAHAAFTLSRACGRAHARRSVGAVRLTPACARQPRRHHDRNLVDPASSHTLVSKIKPCMSKYKHLYRETANGSLYQL